MLLCSAASWALDQVDGVYQIGTPDDMEEFAELVLEDPTISATLTADIDMSENPYFTIGSADVHYAGTFDGAFHTVTIALESELSGYCALFRDLGDATVCNLTVNGSIKAIGKYCCGLCPRVDGNAVIENVVTDVDIHTTFVGDASHSGLIGFVPTGSTVSIKNCGFFGSIKGATETMQCAGLIGWADGNVTMENVMVIAEFEIGANNNGTWGNLTFGRNPNNIKIKNGIYLNPLDVVEAGTTQITEEDLASGAACFAANGMSSLNPGWFQTLGTDLLPVPNPSHGTVYRLGRAHCDGTAYADEVTYSNTDGESIRDEHEYEDGICQNCQGFDPDFVALDQDGFYNLSSAAELIWFATRVNSGEININARLTQPIDLEDGYFPTIGNTGRKFGGIFDGQMMPISGISAPLFGSTYGATLKNIALESGDINGRNSDLGAQTGSIVCVSNNSTLEHSYSKVNVTLGNEGDCGGIVGKFDGPGYIKGVAYYGTCTSAGWSHAGIAGSSGTVTIEDCFVLGNLISTGGEAKGAIVGWQGQNNVVKNCVFGIAEGFSNALGHQEGSLDNCTGFSAQQVEAGAATWKLNGDTFESPRWFQTIAEEEGDLYPVLDETHGTVFKVLDGSFLSDINELKEALVTYGNEELEEAVAYQGDIDAYAAALATVEAATDESFIEAYKTLLEAHDTFLNSKKAYADYVEVISTIEAFIADSNLNNDTFLRLVSYVEDELEPNEEVFPNGSALYILEHKQLNAEEIALEAKFADQLLMDTRKSDYQPGDEVTSLIVNADLSIKPNFTGWETTKKGSTLTTGTVEGIMTTAEVWNATADVHQTLTGIKNGVYEIRANAATRPASNIFNANDNYIAYLYANKDEVYVQALTEDMVNDDTAIDGINCHLTGTAPDQYMEIDGITYYVPYGPVSAAYAFNGGRYENRVLTNVTDGTLTLGIRIPGSGLANDWMGFGNFRLFYLGTTEEAAEGMTEGMDNYIARANNLINYVGVTDVPTEDETVLNYKSMPNFSNALRQELNQNIAAAQDAATAEELLAVAARFTDIFHRIETCKPAYIEYLGTALQMLDIAGMDESITHEEWDEIQTVVDNIVIGWETGIYTEEEALEMADLKATAFYKRYFDGAPALKNGFYQLASAADLAWFANNVNHLGNANLCGEIVAPIDLEESDFQPIGKPSLPFAGTFKGNLYPITNLSCMFFGTVEGATIDGVNIQGGVVEGKSEFAAHTGSLAGFLRSGTVTRCYTSATVQNGTGDCGGFFGKVNTPVRIHNCMFAGNILSGWSAGGIAGSTDGNDEDVVITDVMIDGRNITYKNGDGHGMFVGWYHDGDAARADNIWVISSPTLTDLLGYKHEDATLKTKTTFITVEQAATGMATYGLNRGETDSPVWFQTLGQDEVPTLNPDSKVVILVDGEYKNAGTEADEDAIQALKSESHNVNVYDLGGRLILHNVDSQTGLRNLPNGLYIIGGRKVMK